MFLSKIIFLYCMQLFVFLILQKGFDSPFSASPFIYGLFMAAGGTTLGHWSHLLGPLLFLIAALAAVYFFPSQLHFAFSNVSECFEGEAFFFLIWESCSCPCKECHFQCLMATSFAIFSPRQEERLSLRRKYAMEKHILFRHTPLPSPAIWSWFSRSNECTWQASTFSK